MAWIGLGLLSVAASAILLFRWTSADGDPADEPRVSSRRAGSVEQSAPATAVVSVGQASVIRPKTLRLEPGQDVRLLLENESPVAHDLIIDQLGVHEDLELGETVTVLLFGLQPGRYRSWCSVDGHRDRVALVVR